MENGKLKVKIEDIEDEGILEFDFDDNIKELENCYVSTELEFKSHTS